MKAVFAARCQPA